MTFRNPVWTLVQFRECIAKEGCGRLLNRSSTRLPLPVLLFAVCLNTDALLHM